MAPDSAKQGKTVVGLFLAAALTFSSGCSMNPFNWGRDDRPCTDANRDGYCDEDGRPVPQNTNNRSTRSSHWYPYFWGGSRSSGSGAGVGTPKSSTGVSTGSKGGIGSSSRSGGGSTGGSSGG